MKKALVDISVLLVFFTRHEQFRQVFEQVRKARPSRLFLYQDGPREGRTDDIENIKKLVIALIFTVIIIVLIGGSFFLITNLFMGSISSNNMDRNMYEDYISIIQEIIQSKENEEKLK